MPAGTDGLPTPLVTGLFGLAAGAIGVVATRIAGWRLDMLSRDELLKTVREYREANEDKDRLLVSFRDNLKAVTAEVQQLGVRLAAEEERGMRALRLEVRRERYIRLLQRRLREAHCEVPPEPEEG